MTALDPRFEIPIARTHTAALQKLSANFVPPQQLMRAIMFALYRREFRSRTMIDFESKRLIPFGWILSSRAWIKFDEMVSAALTLRDSDYPFDRVDNRKAMNRITDFEDQNVVPKGVLR